MIRKSIFLLLFFVSAVVFAQEKKVSLPLTNGSVVFENTVSLDSTYTSKMLYKSAKTWFVNSFNSVKAVIQSEDQINGRFLGIGQVGINAPIWVYGSISPDIRFYIQVDIKDGKYRYKLYNFSYMTSDLNGHLISNNFEAGYNLYLTDKTPKGVTMSRAGINGRLDKSYQSFLYNVNNLTESLEVAMKNSKSDNF